MTDLDRKAEQMRQTLVDLLVPLTQEQKKYAATTGYLPFLRTLETRYGRRNVLIGVGRRNGTLYLTVLKQDRKAQNIKSATICLSGYIDLDKPFLAEIVNGLEAIFDKVKVDPETNVGAIQLEDRTVLERMTPVNRLSI